MDTSRVVSFVERMISDERRLSIQSKLQVLVNALTVLAQNPQDGNAQIQVRTTRDDFADVVSQLNVPSDPTYESYIAALSGKEYFSNELLAIIDAAIMDNAMTPAVARDIVVELVGRRDEYMRNLANFQESTRALSLESDILSADEAQIGFRIPREIFHNELRGWTSELNELENIIRPFSELAIGSAEPIEIGEISTTDPIIFLILSTPTIALIGKSISWSLDQWKKIEEIRKLRAETSKLMAETGGKLDPVLATFDASIKDTIDSAIQRHAFELVPEQPKAGRHNEVRIDLTKSLESLMARVERGMTVEIKFLPNVESDEVEEGNESEVKRAMNDIGTVVSNLRFPARSSEPVLTLPNPPIRPDNDPK